MTEAHVTKAIKRMLPEPSRIEDDIQDYRMADYQEAIRLYVQGIQKCPGIHFVGQFGSVSTPGVSDIDMLVIVDEENFFAVKEESRRLIRHIPGGPYLFWHWEIMLPWSLVTVSSALRTFDGLHPFWGDESLVETLTASSFPLSAITTIVWNSYLWRYVTRLSNVRRLRMLLLLLSNIVQSLAATYRVLGQVARSMEALTWGQESRYEILAEPPGRRQQATVHFLEKAIRKWWEADWQMQEWWTHEVQAAGGESVFQLNAGPRNRFRIRFRDRRLVDNATGSSWRKWIARVHSKISGNVILELPALYLQVAFAVKDTFPAVSMPRPLFYAQAPHDDNAWGKDWQQAFVTYRGAVQTAVKAADRMKMEPSKLITNPFMAPFGLDR